MQRYSLRLLVSVDECVDILQSTQIIIEIMRIINLIFRTVVHSGVLFFLVFCFWCFLS